MLAAPGATPKIRLNAEFFLKLIEPLGFESNTEIAQHLGVYPGNLGRILRGQAVSAEFIARVHIAYPKVPFERLFRVELS